MSIIKVTDLNCKRGTRSILKNINWKVENKEHTIIFGLNGCGKTTLLATISGYMSYNSGEIKLWDTLLTSENSIALRKKIGFVSNSYFDRCFRKENTLNIVLSGLYGQLAERYHVTKYDVQRAKHLLCDFGLCKKIDYPYDLLSRGQQQRVLIARALMHSPELLLLDEPFSGLDVMARQFFLNTVEQIAQESNATVVCVTHYEEEILPIYTNVLLMKDGTIVYQGKIEETFTNSQLTEFFEEPTHVTWKDKRVHIKIEKEYQANKKFWK